MIAAFDVHYEEDAVASAAAVIFRDYRTARPDDTITQLVYGVEDYMPGAFYKRELPCLRELIQCIKIPLTEIIIDGYVTHRDGPGLGQHLYMEMGSRIPVVGVAKNRYAGTKAIEVLRGKSRNPLFVTSAGINPRKAAERINHRHGRYSIPTLLKLADRRARETLPRQRLS